MAHVRTPPGTPVTPGAQFTDDQLHQRACIVCARPDGELLPAGHVETGSGEERLTWAVAACPEHQAVASC